MSACRSLVVSGAALAYLTWRAQGSGVMAIKFQMLRRVEYPRIFQAGIIMRSAIVVFAFTLALGVAFHWI